jgi:sigma-B regulation protein RsbU (phosphoserine phosphatase)
VPKNETVGLLCCNGEARAARLDELRQTGLAVRPLGPGGGEAVDVEAVVVGARDAREARRGLAELADVLASPTPVMVLLDEGESEDRAALLEAGADDCLTQPISARELGGRLGRLVSTAELARQTAHHAALLSREMAHAQRVQRHILPLDPPKVHGLEIVAEYLPATNIGGDLFDVIPLAEGRVAFFMADVAGHGLGAALNTMVIKSQLAIWARPGITVGETLAMMNSYLHALTDLDYATAVYAVLDVSSRELEFAVAGHPNPLLVRPGGPISMLEVPRTPGDPDGVRAGLPLGLFEDGVYVARLVQLEPGDRVFMFTDGLVEWRDPADAMLGVEGLRAMLDASRTRPLREQVAWLFSDLQSRQGGAPPADDINLVAFMLEIPPAGAL